MAKLTKEMFEELSLMPVCELSDRELAQLRRSCRTSSDLLNKVVIEQASRGLLREDWSPIGFAVGYPPEKLRRISDYPEGQVI
jgi:hypothetical protein